MNSFFFFFNDTATTEIYTLSLHDALPISTHGKQQLRRFADDLIDPVDGERQRQYGRQADDDLRGRRRAPQDRKSTRLNSSHSQISYAVFCLKKKKHSYERFTRLASRTSTR